MGNPEPAYITPAKYLDNHDGDTVHLEIVRRIKIRVKDIDAYELSEPLGKEAQKFVHDELSVAKEITVVIPLNNPFELMDINSFERIVGHVWYDGKNLKDELDKKGFRKPKK